MEEKNWSFRSFLMVLVLIAAGAFGWWWKGQVLVRNVSIDGIAFTDEEVLRKMIHVDSSLYFFDLDPR